LHFQPDRRDHCDHYDEEGEEAELFVLEEALGLACSSEVDQSKIETAEEHEERQHILYIGRVKGSDAGIPCRVAPGRDARKGMTDGIEEVHRPYP
jgi:hypothetical protein